MKIICIVFVLLIQTLQCLASDDSPFQLINEATGFCLVKTNNLCNEIRWTTGDRLLVQQRNKCLGVQGKSVGSEISLYDCDENSELQRWECKNETVLALKDQELYIELTADNTAVLSKATGPNNHLTISGKSSGACTRTYRELYAIGGNAAGMPCMFPFQYKNQWYSDCTTIDSSIKRLWCAVETQFQNERWGYCPVTSKEGWNLHPTTGAYYQLNTLAALTWPQAQTSCKQQGASLLSIYDPHEQAYVIALLGTRGNKFWTGLILDPEHGWKWSNGRPYRYMNWDSGHPLPNPGHNCAIFDPAVMYSWQSSPCSKKLGYICYSKTGDEMPTQAAQTGFCSRPWLPYNDHCFYLNRTKLMWSDAQGACRNLGGDLVSVRNVEDQSFLISQLGYESTDELWIGLNDRKTEGLFEWIDHSTVTFTSWEFGKPAMSTEIKDCVLIRGENGNWDDRLCAEKHGFVCMKMSASQPTGEEVEQDAGCKTGWRRHGSYCYSIGTQTKTFDEAKDYCKNLNSYLADVSTGVDNAFLVSLVGLRPEKYFWLGLSNQKNIDEFVWTNKDTVRFTHWNAEMPGHRQGCVAMATGIFAGLWDVLPCTDKQKYICKHLADGAGPTPALPTLVPTTCATGWSRITSRNYCYKLFTGSSNKRTWFEARDYCRAIGGDLLSIHSAAELEELPDRYGRVWIGLSAPDPLTGYVWSDGTPLQFQHWEHGEPNNKNNVESCAELEMSSRDSSGSWNDVHCETSLPWLCQIRRGLEPKPAPDRVTPDYNVTTDGWLEWRGNQYYIYRRSNPMEDARRFCQKRHSDLVTINSEAEAVFLWKQVYRSSGNFWIGLTIDLDKTYEWIDGSPVVFQRWDEDQPRFLNNDEHCVFMTTSMGFWHDSSCGYEFYSICKRSGEPPANATVPPTVTPSGGCPQNWKKIDSKCYNVINSQLETWSGAKEQCRAMGGNLASILTKEVQVMLTVAILEAPTTDLWIGLHSSNGNSFYWTDGRPQRYTNWGSTRYGRFPDIDYEYSYRRTESFSSEKDAISHFFLLAKEQLMFRDPSASVHLHAENVSQPFHLGSNNTLFCLITSLHKRHECVLMSTDSKIGIGKWIKRSCNDTNGYVCLRNLDPSQPDSPEPTITTDYVKLFNDSIKVVTQPMTWEAARKHCEDDGASMASVRNEWSEIYIQMVTLNLKGPVWLGINSEKTGGYYRYVDGWYISIYNWDRGEPSMNRPCVYVDVEGKWKTDICTQSKASICMKSEEVPPTQPSEYPGFCPEYPQEMSGFRYQPGWVAFKGNCYLFNTDRTEWPEASTNCIRHGGSLASIEDPAEQAFIQGAIKVYQDSQSSFWIGLFKTHRGQWLWLDRAPMEYTNWNNGQPYDNSYAVLQVKDGKWSTASRWYDRSYICKAAKILPKVQPTVAKPLVDPPTRGHTSVILLIITVIAGGIVIIFLLFKKSGHRLPIPEKLTTFDNPLFFNNERSQHDLVDANKLVANAKEESPEPVITV